MKKIVLLPLLFAVPLIAFTQNVGVGTTTPHPSAQLEINANNKGILLPRYTTAAMGNILQPAKGLLVYDTTANRLMVNMGSPATPDWQTIVYKSGWSLSGNSGTTNQFLGTTDNKPLHFRINNLPAGYIDSSTRNIAFGLNAASAQPTGTANIAIGDAALKNLNNGFSNIALGDSALYHFNGNLGRNIAIGSSALFNSTAFYNVATGYRSLYYWLQKPLQNYFRLHEHRNRI